MRVLFIADPLESFKPYKDSTFAMMGEAARRGHTLYFCEPSAIAAMGGRVQANASRLHLTDPSGEASPWWQIEQPVREPLAAFDAVLMRKDPPFDMEYVASTCSWSRPAAKAPASSMIRRRCATTTKSLPFSNSRALPHRRS